MKIYTWNRFAAVLTAVILTIFGCSSSAVAQKLRQTSIQTAKMACRQQRDVDGSIHLSEPTITLAVGETKALQVLNSNTDDAIHWFTQDADRANVDENGVVTAVSSGTVSIYAVVSDRYILQCRVTVLAAGITTTTAVSVCASHKTETTCSVESSIIESSGRTTCTAMNDGTALSTTAASTGLPQFGTTVKPTSPELSERTLTLSVGEVKQLTATGGDGVLWFSKNPEIADVSKGVVTAKQAGETVVYAIFPQDVVLSCSVTVVQEDPAPRLSKETLEIGVGELSVLTVMGAKDVNAIQWFSEDAAIADVVEGDVIGIHAGTTTIYAIIDENHVLHCEVTVQAPVKTSVTTVLTTAVTTTTTTTTTTITTPPTTSAPVTTTVTATAASSQKLFMEQDYATLQIGENMQLIVVNLPDHVAVSWLSKNESVVTVDEQGTVTALAEGSTRVYAVIPDIGVVYCSVRVASSNDYPRGDVDGDGTVSLKDATLALTYYAENAVGSEPKFSEMTVCDEMYAFTAADADGDHEITLLDATMILTYYAESAVGNSPDWETLLAG